ncbi:hypothetical protein VD0002_g1504 [Verticillium dahliae]|nr:hypothetical protein VD0002_g1504 [Verticillium dahliae]
MLEELQHLMRRLAGDSTRFVLRQKEWKHKGSSTYQARPMARVHAKPRAIVYSYGRRFRVTKSRFAVLHMAPAGCNTPLIIPTSP